MKIESHNWDTTDPQWLRHQRWIYIRYWMQFCWNPLQERCAVCVACIKVLGTPSYNTMTASTNPEHYSPSVLPCFLPALSRHQFWLHSCMSRDTYRNPNAHAAMQACILACRYSHDNPGGVDFITWLIIWNYINAGIVFVIWALGIRNRLLQWADWWHTCHRSNIGAIRTFSIRFWEDCS